MLLHKMNLESVFALVVVATLIKQKLINGIKRQPIKDMLMQNII